MKKLSEQLDAIARKHGASTIGVAISAALNAKCSVDVSAATVAASTPDISTPVDETPAMPLPVQVFGKPVTPPASDAVIKFEVGKIYAERRLKYVDSNTEYYFIKPIKIVKRTSQFIECVQVNPCTREAYNDAEYRVKIHVYKEFYGCLSEECIRLDKLAGSPIYYASNVITSPDELTQRSY